MREELAKEEPNYQFKCYILNRIDIKLLLEIQLIARFYIVRFHFEQKRFTSELEHDYQKLYEKDLTFMINKLRVLNSSNDLRPFWPTVEALITRVLKGVQSTSALSYYKGFFKGLETPEETQ